MKITKNQDKVNAKIEKLNAKLEKILTGAEDKKFAKKLQESENWIQENMIQTNRPRSFYAVNTIESLKQDAINDIKYDIEEAQKALAEAIEKDERLTAREEKKLAKQNERECAYANAPECLIKFGAELQKHIAEQHKQHFEKIAKLFNKIACGESSLTDIQKNQIWCEYRQLVGMDFDKEAQNTVDYLIIDLMKRVEKKVGQITDIAGMSIKRGNHLPVLNGIIIGTKGKTYVESIEAGGYNIQCAHIRVVLH